MTNRSGGQNFRALCPPLAGWLAGWMQLTESLRGSEREKGRESRRRVGGEQKAERSGT